VKHPEDILDAAESVNQILQKFHVDAIVIGALALAAHHYVRYTEDLDLGINTDNETLHQIANELREKEGFQVSLREPDANDPLSGVIDITGHFGMLQIINFGQTFPAVIIDGWRDAELTIRSGSDLRLIPLPHLVALKLYAGGFKSKADISELIKRNPDLDLDHVRAVCKSYRLGGLEEIISEIQNR